MERFKLSPCGRYVALVGTSRKGGGLINILDSGTAQWIAQVGVDGRGGVADFAWWADGEGMTVASKNGEISEWDGRLGRVIARWMDEGAVGTTVVNLGGRSGRTQLGGDRWIAVGSSSGVVNVYDRREWAAAYAAQSSTSTKENEESPIPRNPKPVRGLDQLTTPVSHLVFSPDGQVLVMASRWKRDALRLGEYIDHMCPGRGSNRLQFTSRRVRCTATGRRRIRRWGGYHRWQCRRIRIIWQWAMSRDGSDYGRFAGRHIDSSFD